MDETEEPRRESAQDYREMDAEGRVSAGNLGDNEENAVKRKWIKLGAALNAPLNVFSEKAVKPVINHERFNSVAQKDVRDYGEPFKKVGDAIKPYSDVLIEDTVAAATEIGKGFSYVGRRFSDGILTIVNPEYTPADRSGAADGAVENNTTGASSPSQGASAAMDGESGRGPSPSAGFLAGKMGESKGSPVWTKPPSPNTVEMQETTSAGASAEKEEGS